jgi:hypothetical protein
MLYGTSTRSWCGKTGCFSTIHMGLGEGGDNIFEYVMKMCVCVCGTVSGFCKHTHEKPRHFCKKQSLRNFILLFLFD